MAREISPHCGCNSVVECQLPKLNVAGSNPVIRLNRFQEKLRTRLDELKDLGASASSSAFVSQGLQDQRTRLVRTTSLSTFASSMQQSSRCGFVVLTLLSSRL